jgi:hypothetical protein
MEEDIAPDGCIICRKKTPSAEGWTYLAGSKPMGAVACSSKCTQEAIERFNRTGRCDGEKAS